MNIITAMYSYQSYGHIILLLLIAGVIFLIYRYFTERRKEDETHSHQDV
jgi:Ca2+/Na+ antiporter